MKDKYQKTTEESLHTDAARCRSKALHPFFVSKILTPESADKNMRNQDLKIKKQDLFFIEHTGDRGYNSSSRQNDWNGKNRCMLHLGKVRRIEMKLEAEKILSIHARCASEFEVKDDGAGFLRVIPITGGTFEGKISGEVISGGADWNTARENGISHVFAKYLLKTDDGVYIAVENEGKIDFSDTAQMIKTAPRFQTDDKGRYAWLNTGVYVGALEGGSEPGSVEITVYRLA